MCGSINPGVTIQRDASTCSAPAGIWTVSNTPTSRMERPSMMRRPGAYFAVGLNIAPASTTIGLVLLTSASKVTENRTKVAVGFGELLLRFLAITSGGAHNH